MDHFSLLVNQFFATPNLLFFLSHFPLKTSMSLLHEVYSIFHVSNPTPEEPDLILEIECLILLVFQLTGHLL